MGWLVSRSRLAPLSRVRDHLTAGTRDSERAEAIAGAVYKVAFILLRNGECEAESQCQPPLGVL